MTTPRTIWEALTWLEYQIDRDAINWYNLCDHAQANAAGYAHSGDVSASQNWEDIPNNHRHPMRLITQGQPVFYHTNGDGHIVRYAENGYAYTTDMLRSGRIDYVPLSFISKRMGMQPTGFADNEYAFPNGGGTPSEPPANIQTWPELPNTLLIDSSRHGTRHPQIHMLHEALDHYLGTDLRNQPPIYGPLTKAAMVQASVKSHRTQPWQLLRFLGTIGTFVPVGS
jgi:hypothetical protein